MTAVPARLHPVLRLRGGPVPHPPDNPLPAVVAAGTEPFLRAKGQRWYDWAWIAVDGDGPGSRHLLIRRNRSTGELAF
jgi:hypothetical protein